jgi:hypothetical protein
MALLCLIGIIFFPVFTLGCVLIHYDHPILGVIAIIISIFFNGRKDDKK